MIWRRTILTPKPGWYSSMGGLWFDILWHATRLNGIVGTVAEVLIHQLPTRDIPYPLMVGYQCPKWVTIPPCLWLILGHGHLNTAVPEELLERQQALSARRCSNGPLKGSNKYWSTVATWFVQSIIGISRHVYTYNYIMFEKTMLIYTSVFTCSNIRNFNYLVICHLKD